MNQVIPGGFLGNIRNGMGMNQESTRNDIREFREFHHSNIPGGLLVDSQGIHQELVGKCKELMPSTISFTFIIPVRKTQRSVELKSNIINRLMLAMMSCTALDFKRAPTMQLWQDMIELLWNVDKLPGHLAVKGRGT